MSMRACAGMVLAIWMTACASSPDVPQLAEEAVEAMGGRDAVLGVTTLRMEGGNGSRSRLGQKVAADQPDPTAKLANVVETFDFEGERAALDYEIVTASGFTQHRQEVVTTADGQTIGLENVAGRPLTVVSPPGLFSWGTQNHPLMALERNVISVLRAALDAAAAPPVEDKELNGRMYHFGQVALDGVPAGIYFDPESRLVAAFETTDTETMLGDVPALYLLEDYREVAGVQIPHRITIRKDGEPYADVQFASAAINDPQSLQVFDVPAEAAAGVAEARAGGEAYSPVRLNEIADGVYFVQAYSHNSLLVEFPSFLALVEAPYTEAQSLSLGSVLGEQFPGKPLRYVAVTHPHYDHIGGIRGAAAQGAALVAARGHESELRAVLDAPHSHPPDFLAERRSANGRTGELELFDDKRVIEERGRTLELYAITGSPHVDPMVIAFVPGSGVLFQSDLFFPGTGAGTSPAAEHLLQSVRKLNLRVRTHVGGHGGVAPFTELVQAVGTAGSN